MTETNTTPKADATAEDRDETQEQEQEQTPEQIMQSQIRYWRLRTQKAEAQRDELLAAAKYALIYLLTGPGSGAFAAYQKTKKAIANAERTASK